MEGLENSSECKCCTEIDGCMLAINHWEVVEDVGNVQCITEHPGCTPVCLNRYSLRLLADAYKTRAGTRYRDTGCEYR